MRVDGGTGEAYLLGQEANTMADFSGFPRETVAFLAALEENNDRDWFKAHKREFEGAVIAPARAYVEAMGESLRDLAPGIMAIPRIDQSIFRFHRDTRFSNDKRPFKTHLGIFLWEGPRAKLENPGFYLHLEKDRLMIGGGMHCFTKDQLPIYREAVDHDRSGAALQEILDAGAAHFPGGGAAYIPDYKRVPPGYPKDHPRAELLKKKGVTFGEEGPIPDALFGPGALDYVLARFETMRDLHGWLKANVLR
jgi:uncharacterized protein (TIGR02453 family)